MLNVIGIYRVIEILCVYFCLWRIDNKNQETDHSWIYLKKEKENDQSVKETPAKELKQECYGMEEEPEITIVRERNFQKWVTLL